MPPSPLAGTVEVNRNTRNRNGIIMPRKLKLADNFSGNPVCNCLDYSLYTQLWNDAREAGYTEGDPEISQQEAIDHWPTIHE